MGLQFPLVTYVLDNFCPVLVASIFKLVGFQMSTFQQRFDAAARLALLSRNAANLNRRLSELNRLRDRVRQAELFARKSQRTSLRKRIRQIRHMVKAA